MPQKYECSELTAVVVDDKDLMRRSVEKILKGLKFQNIHLFSNGLDAMEFMTENTVDIVICDLYMSHADGFDVLNFVRGRKTMSDIPFIVVTGEASQDDIVRCADLGADDYVLKPFQVEDLEKKIDTVLTKYFTPSRIVHALRKAERLFSIGEQSGALEGVEMVLNLEPKSARARYFKAVIVDSQGKDTEAIQILTENLRDNPKYYKNYVALADIYMRRGEKDKAKKFIAKELEVNPKQTERQVQYAKMMFDDGDYEASVSHFRAAMKVNNKLKSALFGLGKAYFKLGNLEKSVYYFKRVRRTYPEATKPLEAIVKYCTQAGSPKIAEIALRDEKKAHPERLDTYLVLAKFYASQDMVEQGIKVIDECLKRTPNFVDALKIKAALHYRINEFEDAISAYKRILKVNKDISIYYKMIETMLSAGKHDEAITLLYKLLGNKSTLPQTTFLLADGHFRLQQYTKAYFLYKKLFSYGIKDDTSKSNAMETKQMLQERRRKVTGQAS